MRVTGCLYGVIYYDRYMGPEREQIEPSIRIVSEPIAVGDLANIADTQFGDLVKAVVDIEAGIMAIGGELHADEEAALLEQGSEQANLWGINLYPGDYGTDGWLEYDSMINLRPSQNNRSRGVDDPTHRQAISAIVARLVVAS